MNERIQELESQCWEPRQYGPAWFDSEKFALLIVRECAALARNKSEFITQLALSYAEDRDEHTSARATAWQFKVFEQEVKRHFGVEE